MRGILKALVPIAVLPFAFASTVMAQTAVTPKQVIQNTDTETYQQQTVIEKETISYQGQTLHVASTTTDQLELTKQGVVEIEKEVTNGKATQMYVANNKVYENTGTGWSMIGKFNGNYLNEIVASQSAEYQNATSKAIKGGHEFRGNPTPAVLQASVTGVLSGLGLSQQQSLSDIFQ
ncbi:hypothetical protein, partial [Alicyclobacillus acidiphilus]